MPLVHFTKWFAVEDAKLAPVTLDVSGSATTYGAIIDLPGVKTCQLDGTVDVKELRGDNTLLDKDAVLTGLKVKVEHAKVSLDTIAALFGLTVVDSGTTPNQKSTLSFVSGARPKPVKLEAKTPTGGIDYITGDGHIVFYKGILSGFPMQGFNEEDYQTVSFELECFPTNGTGLKWMDLVLNETAAAIV